MQTAYLVRKIVWVKQVYVIGILALVDIFEIFSNIDDNYNGIV